MKLHRVLVVYKKSAFQVYGSERQDPHFLRLLQKRHAVADRFVRSHVTHVSALTWVRRILRSRDIEAKFIYRARAFNEMRYDLILSVGGDGTFLEASHYVFHRPLLGLNSNPADSVGNFCGATIETLHDQLDRIEAGRAKLTFMTRLRVRIERRKISVPILNDVLVTHANPAATSRYFIQVHRRREEHKSSGIWFAPAAGSTAAILGAGGKFQLIASRKVQYKVRELYQQPGHHLRLDSGFLNPGEKAVLQSKMRAGKVFLDGPHLSYPLPIGARVEISATGPMLKVFHFNERRRKKLWS